MSYIGLFIIINNKEGKMKIRYTTISKTGRRHNNEDAFKFINYQIQTTSLIYNYISTATDLYGSM